MLSHSRLLWLCFYRRQAMAILIEGFKCAFRRFGGIPEGLLFDRMRAVVDAVVDSFRTRSQNEKHLHLWVDVTHHKVRVNGRVVSKRRRLTGCSAGRSAKARCCTRALGAREAVATIVPSSHR